MDTAERALCFFPDPAYTARAKGVFAALGISCRAVLPGEAGETVGALAGLPVDAPGTRGLFVPRLTQPMMVLCGLSRQRMDLLFAALRSAGAPPPDRKAILTPTNLTWTFAALYDELGREHAAMHKT